MTTIIDESVYYIYRETIPPLRSFEVILTYLVLVKINNFREGFDKLCTKRDGKNFSSFHHLQLQDFINSLLLKPFQTKLNLNVF